MSILLIEDEHSIALPLSIALTGAGFSVIHCELARDGLDAVRTHSIELVLLDIGLPDINGLHALKMLREFSQVPVIVLTARAEEADKLFGLELGADDYVTKPFSPKEVIARIKAIIKRSQIAQPLAQQATPLIINNKTLSVTLYGQPLVLTPAKFRILAALAEAPGVVCSRDNLLNTLGQNCTVYERNIDTHIKTLRAKCRACSDGDIIKTHRGFGYSLALAVQPCP